MGATSPERHPDVAVTPFQSDVTGKTQRCRSRHHHPERRDRSDTARSLAKSDPKRRDRSDTARSLSKSDPKRRLAATPPGRSRSLDRPPGATTGGRCAPSFA
ncbi:hypothetical protein F2Q69_00011482 [Brassica cretica]|uniref:Uncharacterized protein n=1 Tax=Brassica cretica TaxID=69181 RepID=A0A8S9QS71_BRACR|nr:hypothetical protein F2Q69_00011482 [Brassica cretica]